MAQQTAVNILVNYMLENFHLTDEALEKFEQAKEIEKKQIENAYLQKRKRGDFLSCLKWWDAAEDYYNKTYTICKP